MRLTCLGCLIVLALVSWSCGDDGAGQNVDAATPTVCLPTDDLMCETATQMCVVTGPFGPTNQSSCESVPSGRENDRTCGCAQASLCPVGTIACTDTATNTIYCDNGSQ